MAAFGGVRRSVGLSSGKVAAWGGSEAEALFSAVFSGSKAVVSFIVVFGVISSPSYLRRRRPKATEDGSLTYLHRWRSAAAGSGSSASLLAKYLIVGSSIFSRFATPSLISSREVFLLTFSNRVAIHKNFHSAV